MSDPYTSSSQPSPDPYSADQQGPDPQPQSGPTAPPGYSAPPPGYGYPQPGYPQGPYPPPGYPQYAPDPPGKTMGIIGFVLAFVFSPAGIVVSALALSDSKKVGYDNALGKWGLWLSIIFTAIAVLAVLAYVLFFVALFGAMGPAMTTFDTV